jgi:hypothetical protein
MTPRSREWDAGASGAAFRHRFPLITDKSVRMLLSVTDGNKPDEQTD